MVKSQHFTVGKFADTNKDLAVDIPRLVDTRLLIQANSGGGKSYLLRLIAERVAGKIQMIILDPEGEFATLREQVDIALVGQGGEMATDVRSATLLARKLVELRVSAIVDLYDLKLPDRRKYVRLFLESLMNVPRVLWHPLLVVLDEAHLFSPEKSAGESESTNAVIALMSQGRKRGFAGILSTQRLSKLHKDAAAESNNVVIGRTWLDVDQQRAGDLLGMNKADRQQLRDLNPGEFYAFGPAFNTNGVVRFQSDQVATTHPKAGERHLLEVPRASAAIQEVVQQIGDLPAQAEEETRTLEQAQRRVLELERQLRMRPVETKIQPRIETRIEVVEKPVLNGELPRLEAAIKDLAAIGSQFVTVGDRVVTVGNQVVSAAHEISSAITRFQSAPAPARPAPRPAASARPSIHVPTKPTATNAPIEGLTRPQQAILDAIDTFAALGIGQPHKSNVAVFANQSPSSSGYTNNLGTLRSAGLVAYPGPGLVELTDGGKALAHANLDIQSLGDLHAAWFAKLSRPKARVLAELIEIYPEAILKSELAERAGQSATSSGYTNNLGSLRSLGLVYYPRPGYVGATELLFPTGLV